MCCSMVLLHQEIQKLWRQNTTCRSLYTFALDEFKACPDSRTVPSKSLLELTQDIYKEGIRILMNQTGD